MSGDDGPVMLTIMRMFIGVNGVPPPPLPHPRRSRLPNIRMIVIFSRQIATPAEQPAKGRPMADPVSPSNARKTWRTLEPLHALIYVAPEAADAYADLGIEGQAGYFASRAAPLGAVPAEVVVATFYNFHPDLVRSAVPAVWSVALPERVTAARMRAADGALRRTLSSEVIGSPEMTEAAELARNAAETAGAHLSGRPLFAAHSALPWPDEPHLVFWHAVTLLREFRGDGHVALLRSEDIAPCEALVIDAATGQGSTEQVLRTSRAWSAAEWGEARNALQQRGWLDHNGTLTDQGRAHRQAVEDRTDALAAVAFGSIGPAGCARLRELGKTWSRQVVASGAFETYAPSA